MNKNISYNLTINNCNKIFKNFEKAKSILERALKIAIENQKKYDGVQVLNYMSIDEVNVLDDGTFTPIKYDLIYVDGSKLIS